jgi:hypothetical protein
MILGELDNLPVVIILSSSEHDYLSMENNFYRVEYTKILEG